FPCGFVVPIWRPGECEHLNRDVCFRRFQTDFLELFRLWIEGLLERLRLGLKVCFEVREPLRDCFDVVFGAVDIRGLLHRPAHTTRRCCRTAECRHARSLST